YRIEDARWRMEDGESRIEDYQQPNPGLPSSTLDPEISNVSRSSVNGFRRALFLAAVVVLAWGVMDDVLVLRPRWKLIGQTAASAILVTSGLIVKRVWLFGYTLELGWLGVALTLVWLVGSMNAVNMLDGLDGLASTVGLVICG